ncbi:serine/threonine-protein kinase [Actinomarinicola tropica]|uniref:Protein kinase domain-containing protein n=1 Tax=Actinomarinicola tropica TaxID=2789776 RepID=A0A5Q2RP84_9ACTN|nr:hypothetical protein [Actinomarinicola tropica]QGG95015.1 hypothetical protein GH723_07795 [Actinomarinicola tropica]
MAQLIVDTADPDPIDPADADAHAGWRGGRSLRDLADVAPLPWSTVARIGASVAAELAELHAAGRLHGAIRPDTVVAFADGRTWLVDADTATHLPTPGHVRLAPEVRAGEAPVPASDVYALAVCLLGLLGHRTDRQRVTALDADSAVPPAGAQVLMGMLADRSEARLDAATAAGRLEASSRQHPSASAADLAGLVDEDEGVVVPLFPEDEGPTDAPTTAVPRTVAGLTTLAAPLSPRSATPRRLGVLALTAVTALFALLFTFASPAPDGGTGDVTSLVAVDDGASTSASASP